MRPINAMIENPLKGMRGNTISMRNIGPMEFLINVGVGSVGGSMQQFRHGGSLAGDEGSYLMERDLNGFTRPTPSMKRSETVQGGALRTFPLDYSVEAVKITSTMDGLPMNAKVELWGTSSILSKWLKLTMIMGRRGHLQLLLIRLVEVIRLLFTMRGRWSILLGWW
jgi:hypothetical protein